MFQSAFSVPCRSLNNLGRYLKRAINSKCAANFCMEVVYVASINILKTIALDRWFPGFLVWGPFLNLTEFHRFLCVNSWYCAIVLLDLKFLKFQSILCLQLYGKAVQGKIFLLGQLDTEDNGIMVLWNIRNWSPVTEYNISEDFTLQHHCCENLRSHILIAVLRSAVNWENILWCHQ